MASKYSREDVLPGCSESLGWVLTPLRKVPLGLAPYGEGGKVGFAAGHGSDTDCSSDKGCVHAAVQLPSGCVGRASAPLWKVTAPHWEVCDRTRMVVFIGATELARACLAWRVPQGGGTSDAGRIVKDA